MRLWDISKHSKKKHQYSNFVATFLFVMNNLAINILSSFIQRTSTLEHVEFDNYSYSGSASLMYFDAISQNHSIHTVWLYKIDCLAYRI